jgi:hypothetical protein
MQVFRDAGLLLGSCRSCFVGATGVRPSERSFRLYRAPVADNGPVSIGPFRCGSVVSVDNRGVVMYMLRLFVRPFGYLAFVIALAALSGASWLLGETHELGFFSGRLARMLWRYPEVVRRGVQMAWLTWAILFGVALSPIDPLATRWDEVALGAGAFAALWHRLVAGQQVGR